MNKRIISLTTLALILSSCGDSKNSHDVVSQKCLHKFGYAVAKKEFCEEKYPGEIQTIYRNGQTITISLEDGLPHGPKTTTYEHSQTIQVKEEFNKGILIKRTKFNPRGIPSQETTFKTPTHHLVKAWYPSGGAPKMNEEIVNGKLENAQYFSTTNELDSSIINGNGEKTIRNDAGDLMEKRVYKEYTLTYKETYHLNKTPHIMVSYKNNLEHGEKREFSNTGEPVSIEAYRLGRKNGACGYYRNGNMFRETTYLDNQKHGTEKHYIDGNTLSEETLFRQNNKHGPSVTFCFDTANTTWYFNNAKVSKETFEQYQEREMAITGVR